MKTQHTPGPWAADKYGVITGGEYLCTTIAETPVVAWRSAGQKKQSDQAMSNSRLIAAAPDLLAALKDCYAELNQLAFLQGDKLAKITLDKARAAISKAEA